MKRLVIAALALIATIVAGAAFMFGPWRSEVTQTPVSVGQSRTATSRAGVPVETSNARAAKTTSDIRAIGSLQSDESVKIAPEIAGRIAEFLFEEGQDVKQGDVIVKLDDALARAEIDQSEARHTLAKANLDRAARLATSGAGTTQARDEAIAEFETARAAKELGTVRLAKHSITAPFSGVVGIRNVSVGAFIAVGTEIVNLEKLDALKVDFKVPEVFLSSVTTGQTLEVTVDAFPDRTFPGTIYAINPMVDVNGRALEIRARLPNPDRVLRPGLFARILIKGRTEQSVVLIPESALMPRGGDNYVYRIENGKAVETKVQLGERKAGEVAIREGLTANAVVVTAGHQRLHNGEAVEVIAAGNPARS